MGTPSTKECVGNIYMFESRKKVIWSNMDTNDKKLGRKRSYADIVIYNNDKWHIHQYE